jgi:ATP-binding cassette subfamily C protein
MIDKRLFSLIKKGPLFGIIGFRLINLVLSIFLWWGFSTTMATYVHNRQPQFVPLLTGFIVILAIKFGLSKGIEKFTSDSAATLRLSLREKVLKKSFALGKNNRLNASELAQYSVDGIEQLEIYYSRFLPQVFYCVIASFIIFGVLASFAVFPAVILLIGMPLIPITIMVVMRIAKRILGKYWKKYTDLGVSFKENLRGLSTLKAFEQDGNKQVELMGKAETFRKATMSLLSMQLNSIIVMDAISYCGAGIGIALALSAYLNHAISLVGVFMFILLSVEFFIPMRQLGSLFHVAMNGISAMHQLFDYIELPDPAFGEQTLAESLTTIQTTVSYTYSDEQAAVLNAMTFHAKAGQLTAFVGKSGSGKSTFGKLLAGRLVNYQGSLQWNTTELSKINKASVFEKANYVDNQAYLYALSVRDNLLLAKADASDAELLNVLAKVQLKDFIEKMPENLDFKLTENASNLSGGQRQRLILARALLQPADFYIFDEITSGVDKESEEIILHIVQQLAKEKIVIFISHRLYNVLAADTIWIFGNGQITHSGTPTQLKQQSPYFKNYFAEELRVMEGGKTNANE